MLLWTGNVVAQKLLIKIYSLQNDSFPNPAFSIRHSIMCSLLPVLLFSQKHKLNFVNITALLKNQDTANKFTLNSNVKGFSAFIRWAWEKVSKETQLGLWTMMSNRRERKRKKFLLSIAPICRLKEKLFHAIFRDEWACDLVIAKSN